MNVAALRTPNERFEKLPDFPYPAKYLADLAGFSGLRMAYVDAGPQTGEVVLCLHGEPTWGYLYRKMIPVFTQAGLRVIVPDLFGFGRSDKPVDDRTYTFDFHRESLLRFIEALDLTAITLVVHDWGGLLGLTIPVDHPDRIKRLLIMNTGLGVGTRPSDGFLAWRDFVASTPDFDIPALMRRAVADLTDAEAAAYGAPFPAPEYQAGARRFPALVPITPDDAGVEVSRTAARWWSTQWDGPTFMAIGVDDPVVGRPVMERMRQIIAGCPEAMLVPQGHFVPESGDLVALAALRAWGLSDAQSR